MRNKKSGFDRLRNVVGTATFSIAGLLSGISARAASVTTGFNVNLSDYAWQTIGNTNLFQSPRNTSNGEQYGININAFCVGDASISGTYTSVTFKSTTYTYTLDYSNVNAFDCSLALAINGFVFVNPDTTIDLNNLADGSKLVTSDTVERIPDIDTQVSFRFKDSVVRALYKITNTSTNTIDIQATVLGDLGSNNFTTIYKTEDGDAVIDQADLWYITSDQHTDTNGSSPFVTTISGGIDAPVTAFHAIDPAESPTQRDAYALRYPLSLTPDESTYIMAFQIIKPKRTNSSLFVMENVANKFTRLDDILFGMTSDLDSRVLNSLANYAPPTDIIFKSNLD